MSWPANAIVPASGRSSPAMVRKVVVLPAALGPRMTKNSPSATARSTPFSAVTPP